jgi:hypothetical protein
MEEAGGGLASCKAKQVTWRGQLIWWACFRRLRTQGCRLVTESRQLITLVQPTDAKVQASQGK